MSSTVPDFEKLKEFGRQRFSAKSYQEALEAYDQALLVSPKSQLHVIYANQSACLVHLGREHEALVAGLKCMEANPDYFKGYVRCYVAAIRSKEIFKAKKYLQDFFLRCVLSKAFCAQEILAALGYQIGLVIEIMHGMLPDDVLEKASIALKAFLTWHKIPSSTPSVIPCAYAYGILQSQRYFDFLQDNGLFDKSQAFINSVIAYQLKETIEVHFGPLDRLDESFLKNGWSEEQPGLKRDGLSERRALKKKKWSIMWSSTPPSRASLQDTLSLKWPKPEAFGFMRPHPNCRPLSGDVFEYWYGGQNFEGLDLAQQAIRKAESDKNADRAASNPFSAIPAAQYDHDPFAAGGIYPCLRMYPGQSMEWHQAYQRHFQHYREGFLAFEKVCKDCEIYEIYTEECVIAIVEYIQSRISLVESSENAPVRVLELGAGDGRLTHYISMKWRKLEEDGDKGREKLSRSKSSPKVEFHATDLEECNDYFLVKALDYRKALAEYSPTIVLCSWMPQGHDWTRDFRTCPSLTEYILFGPCDTGLCGSAWKTWGIHPKRDWQESPYATDGWRRVDLHDISRQMISKDDRANEYFCSSAVAFRRSE